MATKLHCAFCFDVLVEDFETKSGSSRSLERPSFGNQKYPMFVTWKTHNGDGRSWRLRGCIGTFSARDLTEGLKEYALISAFQDSRFSPMSHREVPFLQCDVSLLTDFERARSVDDWKLGTHGLTIDFTVGGKSYSATYLPEVAPEQEWSKSRTITELIAKAGYRRPLSARLRKNIRVTRYQSSKCSLTYTEWERLRAATSSQVPRLITVAWDGSSVDGHNDASQEEDDGKENEKARKIPRLDDHSETGSGFSFRCFGLC